MFYNVYVLKSKRTGGLYIGFTADLKKRFQEHNRGLVFSTKTYLPWRLIYYEAMLNKADAEGVKSILKPVKAQDCLKES